MLPNVKPEAGQLFTGKLPANEILADRRTGAGREAPPISEFPHWQILVADSNMTYLAICCSHGEFTASVPVGEIPANLKIHITASLSVPLEMRPAKIHMHTPYYSYAPGRH